MIKRSRLLITTLISIILIIGCSAGNNKSVSSRNKTNDTEKALTNQYLVGKGKLNTKVSQVWEEKYGKEVGIFRKDFGEYIGYLIGLGKKPTGGYSIDIKMNQKANKSYITFKEISPQKGNFNTQVITYNYNVIYIKKESPPVEISNNHNGKINKINNIIETH